MGASSRPTFERGYKRSRKVCGFGTNDSEYAASRVGDTCPIYNKWLYMIQRCYGNKEKQKTYSDKYVCDEWALFSNFKNWTDTQPFSKELVLDKDILVAGNCQYGPDYCAYVPLYVNNVILAVKNIYQKYPVGVHWSSHLKGRPFESMISTEHGRKRLGRYATPEEAHKAWQEEKVQCIIRAVERYSEEDCYRQDVANALIARVANIQAEISNNTETKYI